MHRRLPYIIKLRALFVAQALLFSTLLAPVILAVKTPSNVCTMAFCIQAGSCYCKPNKSKVLGQYHNGQITISIDEKDSCCPEDCTTSHLSRHSQRGTILEPTHPFRLIFSVTTHAPPLLIACTAVYLTSLSPRAPPLSLLSA